MNRFVRSILVLGLLSGPLGAEDPVLLGLRGAFNAFAPVPVETANAARSAAADLLGSYLTKQGESLLCQRKMGPEGQWLELQGLKIQRVTAQAVSQADKANGIQEKLFVTVDCEMHRTRKPGETSWSPWANGSPGLFPPGINVEHGTDGKWTASSSYLQYFNLLGKPQPAANPQPATNPATAGLPPGMSRASVKPSPPVPQPVTPVVPATPSQTPTAQPSPSPASAGIRQIDLPPPHLVTPPVQNHGAALPVSPTRPFDSVIPLIAGTVVVASAIVLISRKKRPARPNNPDSAGRISPPLVPHQSVRPLPPPLPTSIRNSERNPIDLMQRRDNLMTPAELAFFAVLEPIVRSSYMISSKVRLADLFDVRQERGQQAAFNKIVGKHIDFILTDYKTSRILCGIELDDSSHDRPDRIERDRFVNDLFAEKQLPLLRVPVSWTYHPMGLRAALSKAGLVITDSN